MDEIHTDNEIFIINNDENKEILNKKLYDIIINNKEIFINKNKKLISKDNFLFLIKIINEQTIENYINFLSYLNAINYSILKTLFLCYIEYDFEENEEKSILEVLSKIIGIYFHNKIFHFIYKKLSVYYINHDSIKDIKFLKRFEKIFQIWKLLYDFEKISTYFSKDFINHISPITFFKKTNKKSKNIVVKFKNGDNWKKNIKEKYKYQIIMTFAISPILNLNKLENDFYFLKFQNNDDEELFFRYDKIFNGNHSLSFSEINSIIFYLQGKTYSIEINGNKLPEVKCNFNFDSISKLTILKCFYGQIFSIMIIKTHLSTFVTTIIEIKKNDDEKTSYKINLDNNKELKEEDNLITCSGNIFGSDDLFINSKLFKKGKKQLNEIEYFGGFECFIPIFKILKYFINKLKEKDFLNSLNEDNNEYINKIIKYIIDILKIMIKLIYLSENNYNKFKKIIAPLIGSLAEIIESLDDLINSHLIEEKIKENFIKHEIFYILFILILNLELPFNIINSYYNLFEINNDWDMNNFSTEYFIIDLFKDINFLKWYFSILLNYIFFSLVYFDSVKKIPNILNDILNTMVLYISDNFKKNDISFFIYGIIAIRTHVDIFCLGEFDKINNIFNHFLIDNVYYFGYIINLIKISMKVKKISQINGINHKFNSFIQIIYTKLNGTNFYKNNSSEKAEEKKKEIKSIFKYYRSEFDFLKQIFPFLTIEDFASNDELLLNELINYHNLYHHLMKELFVFNRLWSKKKYFYIDSLNKRYESSLKYKNVNYYTTNFQRPIIYPVLDYKNRYPKFSCYKWKDILYYIAEKSDDYNFDLECPNFDKIIEKYNKRIVEEIEKDNKKEENKIKFEEIEKDNKIEENKIEFEEIEKEENKKIYKVCQIKQKYHVKGKILVINTKDKLILYFFNHFYDLKNENENLTTCNNFHQNKGRQLCYGSNFKCAENEKDKKIMINIKDIRMILRRIYFYRNSGVEIFTETKSYYFNFYSEDELDNFFAILNSYVKQSKSFFPININKRELGYIRINTKLLSKISENDLQNFRNDFIEFISYISKEELYNLCVFDIIMIINLISNRSYLDLFQYPVFPLLFFYDNGEKVDRDLGQHIAFQYKTDKSKARADYFNKSYNDKNENEMNEDFYFFNTHYSNIVYACNFMIRLFPYSFISIELQGDGFDDPNRLFYSIEDTFSNISYQKTDLRELIPEFFYLPEMLININHFYFKDNSQKDLVDSVIMPKELFKENPNEKGYLKVFDFIDLMKKKLENINNNLISWLNIIFGQEQRYIMRDKDKVELFRKESYIDNDKNLSNKYSNDEIIMCSVDFGLIPLQTIFNPKKISNFNKKSSYEKLDEKTKNVFEKINAKKKNNLINDENDIQKYKENIKEYFLDKKIEFKYDKDDINGKLEVYIDNNLISGIYDHTDKIIDVFFNERLNMFATTSYDSFSCVYIIPNKLISIIKHPNKLYFDNIYLSSNPFPTIITFEKRTNIMRSYSLSGLLIKEKNINEGEDKIENITIVPIFNLLGGARNDRIKVTDQSNKLYKILNLPFFDEFR